MSSDNRKVSIELPRSAVLQECQNTAKVRSFMDTFAWQPKSVHKTAKVRSFVDTWDKDDFRQPKSVHKTAKVRSFCNFELRQPKSVHKTA